MSELETYTLRETLRNMYLEGWTDSRTYEYLDDKNLSATIDVAIKSVVPVSVSRQQLREQLEDALISFAHYCHYALTSDFEENIDQEIARVLAVVTPKQEES